MSLLEEPVHFALSSPIRSVSRHGGRCATPILVLLLLGTGLPVAQTQTATAKAVGCSLHGHVYTCDGDVFQTALSSARTVAIETHNVDGIARDQLTRLVTVKLGKAIASQDNPPQLIFLMIPIVDEGGITRDTGNLDLGTLRIYAAAPDGSRGSLLWAENFSSEYMPWPAVVHGLILQFESHFHIH